MKAVGIRRSLPVFARLSKSALHGASGQTISSRMTNRVPALQSSLVALFEAVERSMRKAEIKRGQQTNVRPEDRLQRGGDRSGDRSLPRSGSAPQERSFHG